MSVFAAAARLIGNLVSLGQNALNVADYSWVSAEYRAANLTSMSADAAAAGLSAFAVWGPSRGVSRARAYRELAKTSPILWALTVVEALELTTGLGSPHEGDDLKSGSEQFAKICEQLGSIFPDDSWQGSASQAYAKQNKDLQDLAEKMQKLDSKLAATVKDQAEWVTHARLGFGILKDLLITAFIIEILMRGFVATYMAADTFAKVVAVLGIAVAVAMVSDLFARSIQNTQRVNGVAVEYGAVAADAYKLSVRLLAAKAKVPAAEQSTVSSFEDISAGLPKMSAPPQAPGLAGVASGSGQQRPLLSALSGEGDTRGDGSSEIAGTPSAPGFTMPTLAQVSAMSGQAAKLSGQLSQHANVVNQAMGQIQQIAQMAQQGKEAAAPAKEAALAGAAPAEATERAPIEAAPVGAAQTTDEPQRAL
jgi:uncharacterized protein YukE